MGKATKFLTHPGFLAFSILIFSLFNLILTVNFSGKFSRIFAFLPLPFALLFLPKLLTWFDLVRLSLLSLSLRSGYLVNWFLHFLHNFSFCGTFLWNAFSFMVNTFQAFIGLLPLFLPLILCLSSFAYLVSFLCLPSFLPLWPEILCSFFPNSSQFAKVKQLTFKRLQKNKPYCYI